MADTDTNAPPRRIDFCASQITTWERHAARMRDVLDQLSCICADENAHRPCFACSRIIKLSELLDDDVPHAEFLEREARALDEKIEAVQQSIKLCEMEAENWRARQRRSAR